MEADSTPSIQDGDAGPAAGRLAGQTGPDQWLEMVLQETAGTQKDESHLAVLQKLEEIRGRRPGEPFSPNPVGVEMVSAVLAVRYGGELPESMAATIANSLGDDSAARSRLEALWDRLSQNVRGS